MSPDEVGLVRAVIDNREEDTPRLMYADWLEEFGNPLRAEFIRLSIDYWRGGRFTTPAAPSLLREDAIHTRLYNISKNASTETLYGTPLDEGTFLIERGFVYYLTVPETALVTTALRVARRHPLTTLAVYGKSPQIFPPAWAPLRRHLHYCYYWLEGDGYRTPTTLPPEVYARVHDDPRRIDSGTFEMAMFRDSVTAIDAARKAWAAQLRAVEREERDGPFSLSDT